MKFKKVLLIFCLIVQTIVAQYNDPIFPKPQSGYGSDGTHPVRVISFPNPDFPEKNIEIYHPNDISTSVPTIFYSHAYGGNISLNIIGLLNFVAKKGYAIVFVPYQTTGVTVAERYDNLLHGFLKAARDYPSIIDTTRVGFMGHSFGGGASFGNAFRCFRDFHWGANGRFIYALAQWYSYNIDQNDLENFFNDTKLLVEVFDDDVTNDHRMAIDIFNTISIPDSEKDFILLKSDTINGHIYAADHMVPNTSSAFDVLDYYAYYRLLDALCDYTFNGNSAGRDVALGNGSTAQVTMPEGLKNLVQTDQPQVKYPESKYLFSCNDSQNPRKDHCPAITEVNELYGSQSELTAIVNPVNKQLTIIIPGINHEKVNIFNSCGQQLLFNHQQFGNTEIVDIAAFKTGVYLVRCGKYRAKFMVKQ